MVRIPLVQGVIRRRILLNYRADPSVVASLLPAPFRPKLYREMAIVGVCLIRLEHARPSGIPSLLGIASENAAHRMAVIWDEESGSKEGVYIPRRDTNSKFNQFAGGRIFPGQQHPAQFKIDDDGQSVNFWMESDDGTVSVSLKGCQSHVLPSTSIFDSLQDASAFFEPGEVGFSATEGSRRLDGLRLKTFSWAVSALSIAEATSSYYEDVTRFPPGSIELDHALVMRDLAHEWQAIEGYPQHRRLSRT